MLIRPIYVVPARDDVRQPVGARNYVLLDPAGLAAHVFHVEPVHDVVERDEVDAATGAQVG